VPVTWLLSFTSDPGDPIGMGQAVTRDQTSSEMHGAADRRSVSVIVNAPGHPENDWSVAVGAPVGTWLVPGMTYSVPLSQGGSEPQMSISGQGRGCGGSGTFTVDAIAYGADERLRTFVVDFEQHCNAGVPALRGRFEFHGA
jgi:hypothetical protein